MGPVQRTEDTVGIATRLLDAAEAVSLIPTISSADPGFDLQTAYRVLESIAAVRRGEGWQCVGRKIGFTNRSIWARYGVDRPMWAHIWDRTALPLPGLAVHARRLHS